MITAFYAGLCALLIVRLSRNVIGLRRQFRVPLGDGGHAALQAAIRAQGNAVEYIPITLLLMLLLELSGAASWLTHLAGIALISGRLIHASALKHNDLKKRVLGMKTTFYLIISLAILNMGYFLFHVYQNVLR